jgi:hypothetical protein
VSASGTRTPGQIQADIERTRAEVGDTVEALAEKTDVKARVHDRVEEVKAKVAENTPDSTHSAAEKVRANPVPFAAGAALLFVFWLGRRSARR